jgi:hypothetical protein
MSSRQRRMPQGAMGEFRASSGRGKRGGARVIYFNAIDDVIWLLIVYTKAKFDNLPTEFLAQLKQGVEDAL